MPFLLNSTSYCIRNPALAGAYAEVPVAAYTMLRRDSRQRTFAANGRGTTSDIGACTAAAAAAIAVAYHAADSVTDGIIGFTRSAACIKGTVSIADTVHP